MTTQVYKNHLLGPFHTSGFLVCGAFRQRQADATATIIITSEIVRRLYVSPVNQISSAMPFYLGDQHLSVMIRI